MRDVLALTIVDVEAVTVRAVAGDGHQAELLVKTKRGELVLRLIGRRAIRVTDLRRRDKRKAARGLGSLTYQDLAERARG